MKLKHANRMAIDDLPGNRCAEALALLGFMRRCRIGWFPPDCKSGQVALDLACCGYLRLIPRLYRGRIIFRAEVVR